MKTVTARLHIEMIVSCPNDDCGNYIDLLDENDTDDVLHDDEGDLLKQMFPTHGSHDDFECDEVTCTECKTVFNVKGLEW
jgi:hypothetical protein